MLGSRVLLAPPEPHDVSFSGRVQGAGVALLELCSDSLDGLQGLFHGPAKWGQASLCLPALLEPCSAPSLCLSSAAAPVEIFVDESQPPPPVRRRLQASQQLQKLFPGFKYDSVLLTLSLAEIAAYGVLIHLVPLAGGLPTPCGLYSCGAAFAPTIASGALWRLVMPTFLHASLSHVVANVLFQLRLGFGVEEALGSPRFTGLYFGSGAFGTLVSAALAPEKFAVGCSTSGMGVLGASVARAYLGEPNSGGDSMVCSALIILVVVNLAQEADVFGHLGGFGAGFLLYCALRRSRGRASFSELADRGAALVTMGMGAMICWAELGHHAALTPEMLGIHRCLGMPGIADVATQAARIGSAMQ